MIDECNIQMIILNDDFMEPNTGRQVFFQGLSFIYLLFCARFKCDLEADNEYNSWLNSLKKMKKKIKLTALIVQFSRRKINDSCDKTSMKDRIYFYPPCTPKVVLCEICYENVSNYHHMASQIWALRTFSNWIISDMCIRRWEYGAHMRCYKVNTDLLVFWNHQSE